MLLHKVKTGYVKLNVIVKFNMKHNMNTEY